MGEWTRAGLVGLVLAAACGSAATPAAMEPSAPQVDAGAAGGAGGKTQPPPAKDAQGSGGALADAAAQGIDLAPPPVLPDASADLPPIAVDPDAAAAADAEPALGAFPLDAVKAAKAQLYAGLGLHLEGPTYRDGEVFFAADGNGGGLMRVDANRKLSRYHPRLAPIGSYLLGDGTMLYCDHTHVLVQIFRDGSVAVLATDYQGQAIDYCNDVTLDGAGNIYMSLRNGGSIFRLSPAGEMVKVLGGLGQPNGVEVDRESKYLYYTVPGAIMRLTLPPDGGTGFGKPQMVASAQRADGLAFDAWGNLWTAPYGSGHIVVYDPAGKVIANVDSGGPPINLTFGGPDGDTIFVATDYKGIFKIGPIPGLRGFLQRGAPKYPIKRMLDLVPAN